MGNAGKGQPWERAIEAMVAAIRAGRIEVRSEA
jgi:hypothetical protein